MKTVKVCHIITKLELGGAQRNTLYTVSHLDRERFQALLIAGAGGILDEEASRLSGVRVFFVRSLVREIRPLRDLAAFINVWRILRRERPDIVHTHSSKAGIIGRWAARLAGIPMIIHTFHGFPFHAFQPLPVRWLYIFLERITAPLTSRLIAVTTEDIRKGLDNGIGRPGQYTLIRSGIDLSYYKGLSVDRAHKRASLGIAADSPVVTTIGPFKPQKNLEDFVRVAGLVAARCPQARFLEIGDGTGRQDLEACIASLGLAGTVLLLGWRQDTGEILAASDVFVMTSLWEGLPRSVLEAMSLGLPVVANAVDGSLNVVDGCGWIHESP
jgi:glycosyltransferase involved in cell wall biosynthesis